MGVSAGKHRAINRLKFGISVAVFTHIMRHTPAPPITAYSAERIVSIASIGIWPQPFSFRLPAATHFRTSAVHSPLRGPDGALVDWFD